MDKEKAKIFSLWTVCSETSWMTGEVLQNHGVATAKRAVVILHCTDVTVISNWHSLGLSTLHDCERCSYLATTFIWLHTPCIFTIWLQRRRGWFILICQSEYFISCPRGTWFSRLRMSSRGFCSLTDTQITWEIVGAVSDVAVVNGPRVCETEISASQCKAQVYCLGNAGAEFIPCKWILWWE